jgi:hypothetical protein
MSTMRSGVVIEQPMVRTFGFSLIANGFRSDVIHIVTDLGDGFGKRAKVDFLEFGLFLVGNSLPGFAQNPSDGAGTSRVGGKAVRATVDDRHDFAERNFLRSFDELVSSACPTNAGYNSGALELKKNLHQESRWNAMFVGNLSDSMRHV